MERLKHSAILVLLGALVLGSMLNSGASAKGQHAAELVPAVSDDTLRIVRQPGNLLFTVQAMIDQKADRQLFRATVVATTANTVRIQRTGHDPEIASYAVLDNFPYPKVDDEVLIAKVGAGWMVVGAILRTGLDENYLKIETVLRILPGGKITWGSDGLNEIDEDKIHIEAFGTGATNQENAHIEIQKGTSQQARIGGNADSSPSPFTFAFIVANGTGTGGSGDPQVRLAQVTVTGTDDDDTTRINLGTFKDGPVTNATGASYTQLANGSHVWEIDANVSIMRFTRGTRSVRIFGPLVLDEPSGEGNVQTISSGAIEARGSYLRVDTEGAAASDILDTINPRSGASLEQGQVLIITAFNSARTIEVRETGNIALAGSFDLTHVEDTLSLIFDVNLGVWLETSRSNNN